MKYFSGIFDFIRLVVHRRFFSKKKILKYQTKQLKKIYKYAIKNSVFYNELYKGLSFNTLNDFYKLPLIDKRIMMENFSDLNTCGILKEEVLAYAVQKELEKDFYGYFKDEYVIGLSSGTSGNKGLYITPRKMTERLPAVFLARSGFPLSLLPYRILFMLRIFSQGFEDINSKIVSLNYLSTMEKINEVIDSINKLKINILMAPPSFIRELIPHKDKINVNLKKIMTYAEVLEIEDKIRFEKFFNTEVIEIYQASEGQMASACKKGHLHINEDLVFIELYDDNNNLITQEGIVGHKMIITNLVNYAQPLIRYEMNDMVVLDSKCDCGSNFRRIKKVLGRHDDLIYFIDKDNCKKYVFPDLFVRWIIVTSENIREFQVLQRKINEVTVYLDLIDENDTEIKTIILNQIVKELKSLNIFNPTIKVIIKKITLPKEKNKYKRFINEME